ncbi:MAG TPA: hypothetical protein VMR33_04085 [Candidatus Baltobacteraceae bacterium]|jgi:hypothetical protein|nr:hypothetical protein [Candidatus Baltobacteraceae bacterium]
MVVFEANHSKKLGLPGYSSHQYSLTVRAELNDLNQVDAESKRLYSVLQSSVDREIQQTGFLPGNNGNGHRPSEERWSCSEKQRDLILKIVDESKLDKGEIEKLSQDRFGKSVKGLNKLEASGLIEELIERTGGNGQQGGGRYSRAGAR